MKRFSRYYIKRYHSNIQQLHNYVSCLRRGIQYWRNCKLHSATEWGAINENRRTLRLQGYWRSLQSLWNTLYSFFHIIDNLVSGKKNN
jgi:hypothetical protein